MPLTLEDGTGVAGADTWVAFEDVDEYWSDRAVAAWADADDEIREAAIRSAADYLTFAYRYPGQPTSIDQRLPWPRSGATIGLTPFPDNAIPAPIINAQLVLSVEALGKNLLAKPAADRHLVEETKAAKGLSKTQKFQLSGVDQTTGLVRFPMVEQLLFGLVVQPTGGSFGTARLTRVL